MEKAQVGRAAQAGMAPERDASFMSTSRCVPAYCLGAGQPDERGKREVRVGCQLTEGEEAGVQGTGDKASPGGQDSRPSSNLSVGWTPDTIGGEGRLGRK